MFQKKVLNIKKQKWRITDTTIRKKLHQKLETVKKLCQQVTEILHRYAAIYRAVIIKLNGER